MYRQDVEFNKGRNAKVYGTICHPGDTDRMVILVHGYAAHKTRPQFPTLSEGLAEQGIASIAIDLSGHGDSKLNISDQTISDFADDIEATVNYLHKQYSRIGIFGNSVGGLASLVALDRMASQHHIATVGLFSPVLNFDRAMRNKYGEGMIQMLKEKGSIPYPSNNGFPSFEFKYSFYQEATQHNISKMHIGCPTMVLHGKEDCCITEPDIEIMRQLHNAKIWVSTAGHDLKIDGSDKYAFDIFIQWFKDYM